MTKTLVIIAGVPVNLITSEMDDELVRFRAGMMIDGDGSDGNPDHDPDFQPETTLHINGRALNSSNESFIVVPPQIPNQTKGIVLGSLCLVENVKQPNWMCFAVVGDIGPHHSIGEASKKVASQLGIDDNAKSGGTKEKIIRYTIFVGVPARINGVQYVLQKFG